MCCAYGLYKTNKIFWFWSHQYCCFLSLFCNLLQMASLLLVCLTTGRSSCGHLSEDWFCNLFLWVPFQPWDSTLYIWRILTGSSPFHSFLSTPWQCQLAGVVLHSFSFCCSSLVCWAWLLLLLLLLSLLIAVSFPLEQGCSPAFLVFYNFQCIEPRCCNMVPLTRHKFCPGGKSRFSSLHFHEMFCPYLEAGPGSQNPTSRSWSIIGNSLTPFHSSYSRNT